MAENPNTDYTRNNNMETGVTNEVVAYGPAQGPGRLCKIADAGELSANCSLIDSMLDQSPNPIWIADSKGTLIKINKACADMLKISEKEVVGIYNIFNDNIVKEQGFLPLVQRVFEKGETARFELIYDSSTLEPLQLENHTCVILAVTIFAIRDSQHTITNAVIQHIDITKRRESEAALQRANVELDARVRERTRDLTAANEALRQGIAERKLAEEELGRSEQRYRLLFDQMLNGFALHEVVATAGEALDFRVLDMNPALEKMTGSRKEQVIGKNVRDLFPAREVSWVEQFEQVARTGRPLTFHFHAPSLGKHFDVSAFAPRPDQVAAVFDDVTERHLMEQALRESEELFRTLCAAAPIGIFMANAQGGVIYSNPSLRELAGMSADADLGRGWSNAMHPEDLEGTGALWREAVAARAVYQNENRLLVAGETVWIRTLARPFKGPEGEVAGYVGIVEDTTEQRQVREELLKTQKLESLGVLAGGIAHDFNNILSIILGYLSLARAKANDPELVLKYLKDGERGVVRARELTQRLLTFARGGEPVKKKVRMNELLREAADFGSLGTNISCQLLLSEHPLLVCADEGQLSQVVHNLVINATQAMPEGGVITIRSEWEPSDTAGGFVKFSISDAGTGISDQHKARIFDPYFTTKQGSGLGLTSCYAIIKKHGGTIAVESVLGEGSVFSICLPACLPQDAAEPLAHPAESQQGTGRILIMDDDPLICEVAQAMLEQLGYRADVVADGAAAVERYRKSREQGEPYAAVIMDLTVRGGIGGKEALQLLLGIDPEVKAVVSSGYSADPVLASCREYGFRAVLAKPYNRNELGNVLHELLS
jgi:two-component system, cell cycle sensor histidine kinase and response regulator CckA